MKTNRTGKIARLPLVVREELNRRIEDGQSGRKLVGWLNELPEVRLIVEKEFGGKRILEQNLTAWKQGGYREWVQRREAVELAGRFREEWEMLEEPEQEKSLPETLALWAAGRLVLATMDVRAGKGKERWWMLREMMGHVCKLRGVEQAGQRMKLQERRVEIARMKSGMRNAEREMEETLSKAEVGGVEGVGTMPGSERGGMTSEVAGAQGDQGKSRQIKAEKRKADGANAVQREQSQTSLRDGSVLESDRGMNAPAISESSLRDGIRQGHLSITPGHSSVAQRRLTPTRPLKADQAGSNLSEASLTEGGASDQTSLRDGPVIEANRGMNAPAMIRSSLRDVFSFGRQSDSRR